MGDDIKMTPYEEFVSVQKAKGICDKPLDLNGVYRIFGIDQVTSYSLPSEIRARLHYKEGGVVLSMSGALPVGERNKAIAYAMCYFVGHYEQIKSGEDGLISFLDGKAIGFSDLEIEFAEQLEESL